MKHALALLTLAFALALGCGGSGNKRVCSTMERSSRPQIDLAWSVAHGSMDDDPPRAHVKLAFKGAFQDEIDLGDLEGICKLGEVGALPDDPANGSKVTELVCAHASKNDYATVFLTEPGKLAVRRYERRPGEDGIAKLRDVKALDVPSCARFSAELSQGGDL